MKITVTSDLHGYYPKTSGGDLLIIAGDLTSDNSQKAWCEFFRWVYAQRYKKIVMIAGNHDETLTRASIIEGGRLTYLEDSGYEFEGLKIWGSPWSLWFYGINPYCKAFTGSESDLRKKYALIPDDIDVLITHGPPYGILDKTKEGNHVGSTQLVDALLRIQPRLNIFGHIHEAYGQWGYPDETQFINASHVNRAYEPVNLPIDLEL